MREIPPSSFEPTLEQRLLSLGRMLKDQQESHQQQLAPFLATNTALCKENATLRNAATIPRPSNPNVPRSPVRSESMDNFSPPPRRDYSPINNPRPIGFPSHRRDMDPALHALDDMSLSPFIPAILNQDAPPHFRLSSKCTMVFKTPLTTLCTSAK